MITKARSKSLTIAVATLCLSGTLMSSHAGAAGLTGTERTLAIATMSKSCMESAEDDADLSKIPRAALQKYCRCFATHISDRATRADMEADRSPAMVAIETEAVSVCYDGLPDSAKK